MIRLTELSIGYEARAVVKDVTMTIPDGELTIIIGPNGAGKSTFLKTIGGILPPVAGSINICSHDLSSLTPQQRAQLIAYLPQSRNVPEITGYRMVLHGRFPWLSWPRHYRKADITAAEEAMKQSDAWDLRNRLMTDLSGGERQKVYIAMILAQNTPVILLDEPTTYLDIAHQIHFMQTAKKLAGEGHCVILVLHDLSLAFRYADRLILVHDHSIAEPLSPEDLYASHLADMAFGITLNRLKTQDGWFYYCE